MHRRPFLLLLLLLTTLHLLVSTGCEQRLAPAMSEADIARLTEGQPQIFVLNQGHLTLEGIEDLYLGQPFEEAMAVLNEYCDLVETFDGGWRHNNATFKGCIIEDGMRMKTLRAGFWPKNDNRVSTLEIKDRRLSQPVVRARFSEFADELVQDLPRRGILMMATPKHRLFASWDDGEQGLAHLIVGFQP